MDEIIYATWEYITRAAPDPIKNKADTPDEEQETKNEGVEVNQSKYKEPRKNEKNLIQALKQVQQQNQTTTKQTIHQSANPANKQKLRPADEHQRHQTTCSEKNTDEKNETN